MNKFVKIVSDKYDHPECRNMQTHIFNTDESEFCGDEGNQFIIFENVRRILLFWMVTLQKLIIHLKTVAVQ